VLKDSCCRLMSHSSLESFACLEVWPLGHDRSVLLSIVTQSLIYNCCVQVSSFLLFRWCRWWLSMGTPSFWELDSVLEPITGIKLPKKVFTSRARWIPLMVEWNTSTNMFYLLKHLLLVNPVILKLKCINIIFNEIMVLNASYVCLLYSRFIENHPT
jgi:hypothetical protein